MYVNYELKKLNKDAKWITVKEFGIDNDFYYQIIESEIQTITEYEYYEMLNLYSSFPIDFKMRDIHTINLFN